jgi:hypothetical protein
VTSHLARYQAGDHDGVWRDLRALGLDVFGVRHREDARAVAHEMASRARQNVETLVDRLQAEGFNAAWNDDDATPRPPHFPPTGGGAREYYEGEWKLWTENDNRDVSTVWSVRRRGSSTTSTTRSRRVAFPGRRAPRGTWTRPRACARHSPGTCSGSDRAAPPARGHVTSPLR